MKTVRNDRRSGFFVLGLQDRVSRGLRGIRAEIQSDVADKRIFHIAVEDVAVALIRGHADVCDGVFRVGGNGIAEIGIVG